MNTQTKIATHRGKYHGDDVAACALLKILFPSAKVVRCLASADFSIYDYVVDTGGEHNPIMGRFDHHQGGVQARTNGIPFASAGLVWDALNAKVTQKILQEALKSNQDNKHDYTLPVDLVACNAFEKLNKVYPHIKKRVDEYLFQAIDAWDHGLFPDETSFNLSSFVWDSYVAGKPFNHTLDDVIMIVRAAIISQAVEALRYFYVMTENGIETEDHLLISRNVNIKSISWCNKVYRGKWKGVISPSPKTKDSWILLQATGKKTNHTNIEHAKKQYEQDCTNAETDGNSDNTRSRNVAISETC